MKYRENPFGNTPMRYLKLIVVTVLIWPPFLVALVFDVFIEIYHQLSFRIYGEDRIKRSDYIIVDRHKLKYLNPIEKVNCAYCGYMTGAMRYWSAIADRTEVYWCSIKHAKYPGAMPSPHNQYVDYGNEEQLNQQHPKGK